MPPPPRPLGIIAGNGTLPRLLAEGCASAGRACLVVYFTPVPPDWARRFPHVRAAFEGFGALFAALDAAGCKDVVFAGGMIRPNPDPSRFDAKTREIAPALFALIKAGDDAVLRAVAAVFEGEGLHVRAADEILPALLVPAGTLGLHTPTDADMADIHRAATLAASLGALDVGQGAVVAQGLCLGLETLQGTDSLLDYVAQTGARLRPDPTGARGVLFKMPKPGQDRRMDLPAIGPDTVRRAHAAGLAGIALAAGGVLLLERGEILALADHLNLFIYGLGPETGRA